MTYGRTIDLIAEEFGFVDRLKELRERYKNGIIREYDISVALAKELKGRTEQDIANVLKSLPLREGAIDVLTSFKKMNIKTCVVTQAFSSIIEYYHRQGLESDCFICIGLEKSNSKFTGNIINQDLYFNPKCELGHMLCKEFAIRKIAEKEGVNLSEVVAVGNGKGDICMLRGVKAQGGLSIGMGKNPDIELYINTRINKLKEILRLI